MSGLAEYGQAYTGAGQPSFFSAPSPQSSMFNKGVEAAGGGAMGFIGNIVGQGLAQANQLGMSALSQYQPMQNYAAQGLPGLMAMAQYGLKQQQPRPTMPNYQNPYVSQLMGV